MSSGGLGARFGAADEQDLVLRAIKGDFDAFEELIKLYTQPLWKFVYRLVGNAEDANDTVQQILIQLYRSLPKLDDPARFRPWLFRVARNKCFDQLRRKPGLSFSDISNNEIDGDMSPVPLFPDPAPLPDEIIERRETQQLLHEAIASLPEKTRQVVALRYSTDLSFGEIGEVLGINENSAKTLFQRAKAPLRFYLRQRLFEV